MGNPGLYWNGGNGLEENQEYWTFRMVNTPRPLEEKICLFWYGIFCAGYAKCEHGRQLQIH